MKLTREYLRKLIKEQVDVLVEQDEDDLFGAEDEGEDEDTAEEDTAEDTEGEGEEDAGDEADDDEEAEEENQEVEEIEPLGDEEHSLAKTIDDELNSVFVDFETDALKSAKWSEDNKVDIKSESRSRLVRLLFEEDNQPKIDMETFAADVARLIMNYDSLLDMKAIIMKKAQDFILDKHGKEKVDDLLSILELRYDLTLDTSEDLIAPIAIGASTTAAEGGA